MPKGRHLRKATSKEQRMYEHILESVRKYGRYGRRKKEVAARTVLKYRKKRKTGSSRK